MDPVSCIVTVLSGIQALKGVYDAMEDNRVQSLRLLARLEALAPPLQALQIGSGSDAVLTKVTLSLTLTATLTLTLSDEHVFTS